MTAAAHIDPSWMCAECGAALVVACPCLRCTSVTRVPCCPKCDPETYKAWVERGPGLRTCAKGREKIKSDQEVAEARLRLAERKSNAS